jgi:hypothetical protein
MMTRISTTERDWREIDALRAQRLTRVRNHRAVGGIDARLQALILRRLRAEIKNSKIKRRPAG